MRVIIHFTDSEARRAHVAWKKIEKTLVVRGVIVSFVMLIVFSIFAVLAYAQIVIPPSYPSNAPFLSTTTQDPWFWVMVAGWLFSCLVSGMPEPEKDNSPFYIWAYRSLHLIAASGTAYFQHKGMWPTPEQMAAVTAQQMQPPKP